LLPFIPAAPQPVGAILTAALVASLIAVAAHPRPRWAALTSVAIVAMLVALDINRLQPWVYLYCLMLLGATVPKTPRERWAACAFLMVATYFWSGVQKENVGFVREVLPWLLKSPDASRSSAFVALGYGLPLIEAGIGILLLFRSTRNIAVVAALTLHAIVLFELIVVRSYNSVVWPWNVAMPILCGALFWRNPHPVLPAVSRQGMGRAFIVLMGILPTLSFFNLWDEYLSASLYSGRARHGILIFSLPLQRPLPASASRSAAPLGENHIQVSIAKWALADLNAPPYPEPRVYRAIARQLGATDLLIRDRPGLFGDLPRFR
jgi:hypothetical protein